MIFVRSGMFVYCMKSTRYPGIFKIGISNDPQWRSWWISKTMPGTAVVLFKFELFFAYEIEQTLHWIFKAQNVKGLKGSGKTEWFRPELPPVFWLSAIMISIWQFQEIIFSPGGYWYLIGGILAAMVIPVFLFLAFVFSFLLLCRIIQECFIIGVGVLLGWVALKSQHFN